MGNDISNFSIERYGEDVVLLVPPCTVDPLGRAWDEAMPVMDAVGLELAYDYDGDLVDLGVAPDGRDRILLNSKF